MAINQRLLLLLQLSFFISRSVQRCPPLLPLAGLCTDTSPFMLAVRSVHKGLTLRIMFKSDFSNIMFCELM